jgi:hypothetical protein
MNATWQIVVAFGTVVITALLAPWVARRAAIKEAERAKAEDYERRAISAESSQIDKLFREQEEMRANYRQENAELRARLAETEKQLRALVEEVAEWRAGVRGVHGVWVAVPSSIWEFVRGRVPELPQTKFPGEADGDLPPLHL